jgi:hypothetical protein
MKDHQGLDARRHRAAREPREGDTAVDDTDGDEGRDAREDAHTPCRMRNQRRTLGGSTQRRDRNITETNVTRTGHVEGSSCSSGGIARWRRRR